MAREIWVRVREAQQQFRKDVIDYPTDGALKLNPTLKPKRFVIDVQGYDELGRPTMPIFKVEDCKEIQDAIHNDLRRDPRAEDDIHRNPEGLLIASRLVHIEDQDADRFPQWVGHPTVNMSPFKVWETVMRIREQQKKGDEVLNEQSQPYEIRDVDEKVDFYGHKLFLLWKDGLEAAKKENANLRDEDKTPKREKVAA